MIILHYVPDISRESGGVGYYMQTLAKELGSLTELHIATHKSDNELILQNCHIHYLSKNYKAIDEFGRLIDSLKADIVHTNTCWLPIASFTVQEAWKRNIPVAYSPHGMLEPWILKRHHWTRKVPALLLYQKKSLKRSDVIVATAESEKDNILQLGYNSNIEVVPNGIDINKYHIKDSWNKSNTILFLSRIHVKKGIEILLEAANMLGNKLNDYKIIIAGEGEMQYINKLKRIAKQFGLGNIVTFAGGIYGKDKTSLLQHADVVVLPTFSENFGIVIAEALACGTPVITTKGAPWDELVTRDCGWWTDINAKSIANALNSFLDTDEIELKNMGTNGHELIKEKYNSKEIAKKLVKLYEKLICKKNNI